jgi:hypothetical protein
MTETRYMGRRAYFPAPRTATAPAERFEIGEVVIRIATGATAVITDIDTGWLSVRYDVTGDHGGGDRSEFAKVQDTCDCGDVQAHIQHV